MESICAKVIDDGWIVDKRPAAYAGVVLMRGVAGTSEESSTERTKLYTSTASQARVLSRKNKQTDSKRAERHIPRNEILRLWPIVWSGLC